jgi:hypothetical protein
MKATYDKRKADAVVYKPGDKVCLEGTNISTKQPAKFTSTEALELIADFHHIHPSAPHPCQLCSCHLKPKCQSFDDRDHA